MTDYADEIVYRASVDDKTEAFFERFDRFAEQYRAKANTAFQATEQGADKSAVAMGALIGVVGGLTTKLLDMALAAGQAFVQFAKGSVELAARVETLGINVYRIGERMGYTKEQTDEVVGSLKDLGITTQGAYSSLLLLSRANIDWSEATKLARVAQDAAVIAGTNSSEALERLARGIQKMEPELLDELGITLNRTKAYQAFAETIGKTVKQLTDVEQKQAILNEIYRQSGVVAGSYEASMGTAGKQAASLARHVEELQLAIGNAFLPLYQARIEFMTDALKQLREFVAANEEDLKALGKATGDSLSKGLTLMLKLLELTIKTANAMEALQDKVNKFNRALVGDENITKFQKWWSDILVTAGQAISLIAGGINAALAGIAQVAKYGAEAILGANAVLSGDMSITEYGYKMQEAFENIKPDVLMQKIAEAYASGVTSTAEFLGVLEETDTTVTKVAASADSAAVSIDKMTSATKDTADAAKEAVPAIDNMARAEEALANMRKSNARSEADRLRQEQRQAIEEALQQSQQRLEIERRYADQVQQIRDSIEKQRTQLSTNYNRDILTAAQDLAEQRVQIEQDYHDRIEEIQRNFEDNAEELARSRDAIGMVRLIRENKKQLEEEERNRQKNIIKAEQEYSKRIEDLRKNYTEQQQLLEQSLAEQLAAAEEARQEDYRNMERSLEEQRRLKQMHDRWAEEDRRIALQRQLQDWQEQYGELEGVTSAGLNRLLGSWRSYLGNVETSASQSIRRVRDMLRPFYDTLNTAADISPSTVTSGSGGYTHYVNGVRVTGQGGQISQRLATLGQDVPTIINSQSAATVVPVRPQSSVERRELDVKVSGDGLDAYMQRVVYNTLMEIERNRG